MRIKDKVNPAWKSAPYEALLFFMSTEPGTKKIIADYKKQYHTEQGRTADGHIWLRLKERKTNEKNTTRNRPYEQRPRRRQRRPRPVSELAGTLRRDTLARWRQED
jgi:hypothetical protein